ncbi:MAG TPA: hypothetical protein P5277_02310 [Candidatus Paceibacterota bacterium]|nr:hypothetical protein [Candidatus Paceibacterota bacterium]
MIKSKNRQVTDPFAKKFKFGIIKYILVLILIILILFMITSLVMKYRVSPDEVYHIDKNTNFIEDGSFENFNQTPSDCCNKNPGNASISALRYEDSFEGIYSLKLTSENHCACLYKDFKNFNNSYKYLISFYYKGNKPKVCCWVIGINICNPYKELPPSDNWLRFVHLLEFSDKSTGDWIHFYAESDGTKTVTNYYDDLQVRKLIQIDPKGEFSDSEEYVIKTKADNNVNGEMISKDDKTNTAYYFIEGKPLVTIKFPIYEMVIIIVIMLIITRLILKQDSHKHKEDWE